MALLFIFSGVLLGLVALLGMCVPMLRNLETLIPDYDESKGSQLEIEHAGLSG
jgi:hypothetical protein